MSNLTFLLPYRSEQSLKTFTDQLAPLGEILLYLPPNLEGPKAYQFIRGQYFESSETVLSALSKCKTKYLAVISGNSELIISANCFDRLQYALSSSHAAMAYSDFGVCESNNINQISNHPLCDYQPGSVRDNFDFGAIQLYDVERVRNALRDYGDPSQSVHAGWYELRLLITLKSLPIHLHERLYISLKTTSPAEHDVHFAYVNPSNRAVQMEMERVFTAYAKLSGFFLAPDFETPSFEFKHQIQASVIIPVRNREKTIPEAVQSALSQKCSVPFNILVVDNHSTDGTTKILRELSAKDKRIIHIVPERRDLLIGGCWDLAIRDPRCGRHVMQLDSDDLYIDSNTIERIIQCFKNERCAAVVGSYNLVNFALQPIPPGLIDHREWTPENGRNNALRINGLGAPRAFYTPIIREIGFPNTSYGEDYSVMLAVTRRYQLGRIYEPLYLCRRWEGNSEANISIEKDNANNTYKDQLRTLEIFRRREMCQHQ